MKDKTLRTTDGRIDSIQALRALAFCGVLVSHTRIKYFCGAGKWGVSVFFILSGFMMTYSYYKEERIQSVSFLKNILFAERKIKKFYLLHVVTTLAMSIFMFVGEDVEPIPTILIKLILNLLLIQEYIPIQQRSINGVSWYLCVIAFLYFIFPWILKYMEKSYSVSKARKMIAVLFVFQIISSWFGNYIVNGGVYEIDLDWLVYKFPPMRAIDFAIGCNVGYLFLEDSEKKMQKWVVYELTMWILIIAGNICWIVSYPKESNENILYVQMGQWWAFSVIYTISSCMIIYMFAENKGFITKILTNRVMLYLGNISSCAFLIHYVVFRYIDGICTILIGKDFAVNYGEWIKLTVGFAFTVFITQVWKRTMRCTN